MIGSDFIQLRRLLDKLLREDLSLYENYVHGEWSRRNIEALLDDVEEQFQTRMRKRGCEIESFISTLRREKLASLAERLTATRTQHSSRTPHAGTK